MSVSSSFRTSIDWHLDEHRLIVVFGASGAGKTTFVRSHFEASGVAYKYLCPIRIGHYVCDEAAKIAVFDEVCQWDKRTLKEVLAKRLANSELRTVVIAQFVADLKDILDLSTECCIVQIQNDGSVCLY